MYIMWINHASFDLDSTYNLLNILLKGQVLFTFKLFHSIIVLAYTIYSQNILDLLLVW